MRQNKAEWMKDPKKGTKVLFCAEMNIIPVIVTSLFLYKDFHWLICLSQKVSIEQLQLIWSRLKDKL